MVGIRWGRGKEDIRGISFVVVMHAATLLLLRL